MSAAVVSSTDEFFEYFWVTGAAEIHRCSKYLHLIYFHGPFTHHPVGGSYIFTHVMIVFVLNQVLCVLVQEKNIFTCITLNVSNTDESLEMHIHLIASIETSYFNGKAIL